MVQTYTKKPSCHYERTTAYRLQETAMKPWTAVKP